MRIVSSDAGPRGSAVGNFLRDIIGVFNKSLYDRSLTPRADMSAVIVEYIRTVEVEFLCTKGHMEQVDNGLIPKEVHYDYVKESLCQSLANEILKDKNIEVIEYNNLSSDYPVVRYRLSVPLVIEKNIWNQLGD